MTPEGRVKAKIDRVLKPYVDAGLVYKFMPVPSGYGASSLDYLFCVSGLFAVIEAKVKGKVPTDRQTMMLQQVTAAGGEAFVIDGDTTALEAFLQKATHNALSSGQPQT